MRDWLKDIYLRFKEQFRSVLIWLSALLILVIVFGFFYTLLTPCGHGIKISSDSPEISYLTGIYFSAVTISSLGYGDFSPVGFSRFLVGVEVLLGLVLITLMIAGITSWPLSYHVQRLFGSDAQKRLEDYARIFEENKSRLFKILSEYDVPSEDFLQGSLFHKEDLILRFRKEIENFKSNCIELKTHFLFEVDKQKNFFEVVPKRGVIRVGRSIEDLFFELNSSIMALEDKSKKEILDRKNIDEIIDAIEAQRETCDIIENYLKEDEIIEILGKIKNSCSAMENSFLAVPDERGEPSMESPDQFQKDSEGLENLPSS